MSRTRKNASTPGIVTNGVSRRAPRWLVGLLLATATVVVAPADGFAQDNVGRIDVNRVEEWTFERRDEFLERVEQSLASLRVATEDLTRTACDEAARRPLTGMESSLRAINRRVETARTADEKTWSTTKLRLLEGLSDIYRQFDVVRRGTTPRTAGGRRSQPPEPMRPGKAEGGRWTALVTIALRLAAERILGAAGGVLDLALRLVHGAFGLHLLVTGHIPGGLFHVALELFAGAFHAVLVHGSLPTVIFESTPGAIVRRARSGMR